MKKTSPMRKIALIGNDVPRKCGIATFTHDMYSSLTTSFPGVDCSVVAVTDHSGAYQYGPEVGFEFEEKDLSSYVRAADYLNSTKPEVVCVQHEYGIYGGSAGDYINTILSRLDIPVVTTLHTVLRTPSPEQRRSLEGLCDLSSKVVVMSEKGKRFLEEIYLVPTEKIEVIAHGIPDVPFSNPDLIKPRFGVGGKRLVLTFGLLAPNKGIEYMLQAMPEVVREFPDVTYMVLGATHPNLLRDTGDSYRLSLERMTRELGIERNVIFANKFVERDELMEYIAAADIYVTPYLNAAQITSGTLAYSFGCGKPVISTPYWHAEELLAEGRGTLVPFADSAALATAIRELFRDESKRRTLSERAYAMGREMIWSQSAARYMNLFQLVRDRHSAASPSVYCDQERDGVNSGYPSTIAGSVSSLDPSIGIPAGRSFSGPDFARGVLHR